MTLRRPVLVILFLSARGSEAFLLRKNPNHAPWNTALTSQRHAPPVPRRIHRRESSADPNELETPSERRRRMDSVRELQNLFYKDETGVAFEENGLGVLSNVPLHRAPWTEIPHHQNLYNVRDPREIHMFMTILSGPKPWYFGHLLLPGGGKNLDSPEYRLLSDGSNATTIGSLCVVNDWKRFEEDGRLMVAVQALERFRVTNVAQHLPYAVGTVELLLDPELIESQRLTGEENARASALAEAQRWRPFEFRPVSINGCLPRGIAMLTNYHAGGKFTAAAAAAGANATEENTRTRDASLEQLEHDVWVALDSIIQLLVDVDPERDPRAPIPTQLLAILPSGKADRAWPDGFVLDQYADRVRSDGRVKGTLPNSGPFVCVNDAAPSYPVARRACRLSFAIWLFLMDMFVAEDGTEVHRLQMRQDVLEMGSITERLEAAKARLRTISGTLCQDFERWAE